MNLLLTLGHNASAIAVDDDGNLICGYENERLTHKKSDSSFPVQAIEEVNRKINLPSDTTIYVSHWFTDGKLPSTDTKYWRGSYIKEHFPDGKVYSLSQEFTHHDAHAHSAVAFADGRIILSPDTMLMVMDGFGNFGETISIYGFDIHGQIGLTNRYFGYTKSLGLFYQYATSYMGMRENQDEYKLLGYEAHVLDVHGPMVVEILSQIADEHIKVWMSNLATHYDEEYDPVLMVGALTKVKVLHAKFFDKVLDAIGISNDYRTDYISQVALAYVVQRVVEGVVQAIINKLQPRNLIVAGGLFLNVKLNNLIGHCVPGQLCVMPLSGDQGAAIGVYQKYAKNFHWPGHLFWGYRNHWNNYFVNQLETYDDVKAARDRIIELLKNNKIVNLVRGAMEFGPRALGNTSTLAIPSKSNVEYINTCNKRNTIMPMAPVMTHEQSKEYLHCTDKVVESLKYMVCTRAVRAEKVHNILGGVHMDPQQSYATARVQVTSDQLLCSILDELATPLINTSFNEHGTPICFTEEDVIRCHEFQRKHDEFDRIHTIIVR